MDTSLLATTLELDAVIDPGRKTFASREMAGMADTDLTLAVDASLHQPEHELSAQPLVIADQGGNRIGICLVGFLEVFQQLTVNKHRSPGVGVDHNEAEAFKRLAKEVLKALDHLGTQTEKRQDTAFLIPDNIHA